MVPIAVCVGCGLDVNEDGILVVERADASLNCNDDTGLSVNLGDAPNGLVLGASGISVDIDEVSACNGVELRANGIFAACPDNIIGSDNVGGYGGGIVGLVDGLNADGGGDDNFSLLSKCDGTPTSTCPVGTDGRIRIQNTLCCPVEGLWAVRVYGGEVAGNPGFDAVAYLEVSIDAGAWTGAQPWTLVRMRNQGPGVQYYNLSGMSEQNYVGVIPAGGYFEIQAAIIIHVSVGTADPTPGPVTAGTWITEPMFEFYWQLNQTECCS